MTAGGAERPAFRRTTFTRDGVRRGFIAMQPLAIGVLAHGVTFGLLALGAGFSIFEAVLMSATVYSGTAQTAAVSVLATGAGVVAAVSTVVLLNARYVLHGAALRSWLGQVSPVRAYGSLFLLGDGSWLLAMRAYEAGDRDARRRTRRRAPRSMNPAGAGGIGRLSVPGAVGWGTAMPSFILSTRSRGWPHVCRSPTGTRRHPVLSAPPARTHVVVSPRPDPLRDLAATRGRAGRRRTAGLCRARFSSLSRM